MEFQVINRGTSVPIESKDSVFLKIDNWNDHSYVTMFSMTIFDGSGNRIDVGNVKIAFKGQSVNVFTHNALKNNFSRLEDNFCSIGQSQDFYKKFYLLSDYGRDILNRINDVVLNPRLIEYFKDEDVFGKSLLRDVSLSVIRGQYARILDGKAELTNFNFKFSRPESQNFGPISINFKVVVDSTPNTNIHAVIGRNGIGKTTLLNGMISAITDKSALGKFFDIESYNEKEIPEDYFSSLISVSFSAFDPFMPPKEQPDPSKGTCYFYIGLKDSANPDRHRTIPELHDDCIKALVACFHKKDKTERWKNAISKLSSDENFASMELYRFEEIFKSIYPTSAERHSSEEPSSYYKYKNVILPYLKGMSSGHAIVLLTITRLVALVEEKSLVLMDEPESHLHPPLLSALIRALADLLHDRNGVAVIATHSPVVLQEIPKRCAWKIFRVGKSVIVSRPENETFGENVGTLTSEVFNLEVERSGFHHLLAVSVNTGKSYEQIIQDYNNQLGLEARSILRSLVAERDRSEQ